MSPTIILLLLLIHSGKLHGNRVVIRAEKIYTGLERARIFPVDVVLDEFSKSRVAEEPCPRFKDERSTQFGIHIGSHSASCYS